MGSIEEIWEKSWCERVDSKMCKKDAWKPSLTSTSKIDLESIVEYMLHARGAGFERIEQ